MKCGQKPLLESVTSGHKAKQMAQEEIAQEHKQKYLENQITDVFFSQQSNIKTKSHRRRLIFFFFL